ncbi:MAG: DPP IV N-terminal domain-containing protein [Pirellulaceae bacterium]|nr:DPP IV N-terminal domain-containing protein [Pirellulaceae bacterium]
MSCWLAVAVFQSAICQAQQAEPLQTVAEASAYTATATPLQVQELLAQIDRSWEAARLLSLGSTVEGRSVDALVIDSAVGHSATEATSTSVDDRLTIMLLAGTDAAEYVGKESVLGLVRDLALSQSRDWLDSVRLIVVPNLNADGNARYGLSKTVPSTNAHVLSGAVPNAQGLDLGMDFIKLESPETQALVSAIHKFDVDVLIDMRAISRELQQHQAAFDIPRISTASTQLEDYLRHELFPAAFREIVKGDNVAVTCGSLGEEFRKLLNANGSGGDSSRYMGLRGKLGLVLAANPAEGFASSYQTSRSLIYETLRRLASDADRVQQMMQNHVDWSLPGSEIPIVQSGTPAEESVSAASQRSIRMPMAYAIAPQHAWAISRLVRHGIPVFQLTRNQSAPAQIAIIAKSYNDAKVQGHTLRRVEVQWQSVELPLAEGTYIIPHTQPVGRLAAYLLEPESGDSLAKWNYLDPYLAAGATYPVFRLEQIPSWIEQVEHIPAGEQLTLEHLFHPETAVDLTGQRLTRFGGWVTTKSNVQYAIQHDGQWLIVDAATGQAHPVAPSQRLVERFGQIANIASDKARQSLENSRYWLNPPGPWLVEQAEDLYWVDPRAESTKRLTHSVGKKEELAELSPSGGQVAFVRDNNLWVVDCSSGRTLQLTSDGSELILNGKLDWVYQEELYGRGDFKGFWWSPDSQRLAYLQLGQQPVPEYLLTDSSRVQQSLERTRYPKAGQPLPVVRAWIVDVATGLKREVELPQMGNHSDRLVARVTWAPNGRLWLQVLNRVQNRQDLIEVDPRTGGSRTVLREETPHWIEIRGTPRFLASGDFLWLSDLPEGRTRLFKVSASNGQRQPVTNGDWDVRQLYGVSSDQRYALIGGSPHDSVQAHLLSVDLQTGATQQMTSTAGTHDVSLEASGRFYMDTFSSWNNRPVTTLYATDGSVSRIVSCPVGDRHDYVIGQLPLRLTISARDGQPLQALAWLPSDAAVTANSESRASGSSGQAMQSIGVAERQNPNAKFPVLVHVYGGPGAPSIRDRWQPRDFRWHQWLCSQGYAVVLCDNRSAQGRGLSDSWPIRGQLGRIELQDLEDAVAWIAAQPWADSQRVGLWGWSYGGYMTAYAMTRSQLFKAGIAGAPVTDWQNYDAIYTERYMDLPERNAAGYASSSVVAAADELFGRLLLIHGDVDDNVHLSNSLQLADALQKAGKQFELMVYPRARHAVDNPAKRYHLYCLMTDFLHRNLKN